MEISHPRRILILASPSTALHPVLNALVPPPTSPKASPSAATAVVDSEPTAIDPEPEPIHHITTPYYTARVPVWTDRVAGAAEWAAEWKDQAGAAEVVAAVGAWVVVFPRPGSREDDATALALLQHVADVISHHASPYEESSDAVRLAVAVPSYTASNHAFDADAWDEACQARGGWEFLDAGADGKKNRFGETTGLPRLLEALQSAEWDGGGASDDLDALLGLDEDDASDDEGEPVTAEMRAPILSTEQGNGEAVKSQDPEPGNAKPREKTTGTQLKGTDGPGEDEDEDEDDVEDLQRMMARLQAARDLGADLPLGERRKLAAKAVREVMRGT